MTVISLADCLQVGQSAEVARLVGDGKWLSTGEVAEILECSSSHVIKLFDDGKLTGRRVGNRRRILRTVAEAYRDKMAAEAAGE